jgi:DNA-binding NtrC family response regulator
LILSHGSPLTFAEIETTREQATTQPKAVDNRPTSLDQAVVEHVRKALAFTGGKVSGPGGAAELLGVNPSTLRNKMKKIGINPKSSRNQK